MKVLKHFISTVGAEIVLVPSEHWQHLRSVEPLDHDFLSPPVPFAVRVSERFDEQGQCIGISGPIINGPEILLGLVANCFVGRGLEAWDTSSSSYANVLISPVRARRHTRFSHHQVEGASCGSFPQFRGMCEIYVSHRPLPEA